jgi:hypothetical protein
MHTTASVDVFSGRQIFALARKWVGMTTSILPCPGRLSSWLMSVGVCAALVGLAACDVDQSDNGDAEFRGGELDLDSLKPGECLPLGEQITTATTEAWKLGAGLPKGIIIEDHLLLTSVFEDNVMLRVSGPAITDDDTLVTATATVLFNNPEIDDPCGFCDGLCVDGKCLMDLPTFAVTVEGICHD